MRRPARLLAVAAGAVLVAVALLTAAVFALAPRFDTAAARPADAIVVLSGNYIRDDLVVGETRERVAAGLRLWRAGVAPVVVVTGGEVTAPAMAGVLRDGGVPEDALRIETEASSTLQNALFSRALLGPEIRDVAVVTHRYHLPRAVASFAWAGFDRVEGVAADARGATDLRRALSEALKTPPNAARALLHDLGRAAGIAPGRIEALLR